MLTGDDEIPIARFGRSNIGQMKEVYRLGLGNRYGRMMQAISGVHFNYSFPQAFWPVLAEVLQEQAGRPGFHLGAIFLVTEKLPAPWLADSVFVR